MPKLTKLDQSPAGRAAMMVCEIYNVPVDLEDGDIIITNPEEVGIEKRHSNLAVPVLQDGENTVMDSHAILPYIAETFGDDSPMYPKDEEKRSIVDERLMLSYGLLFQKLCNATYSVFQEGKAPSEEDLKEIEEGYNYLEEFLSLTKFISGDEITLADVAAISDVTSLVHVLPVDAAKFPKTTAWIEEMEKQPYVQKSNAPGAELFGKLYKEKLGA